MSRKPVVPRSIARRDMREATIYYARTAGDAVAAGFVQALQTALDVIAHQPGGGSPRLGLMVDRPDVRSWRLTRYPYLVFYRELEDRIEVLRVLHGHRDVASLLSQSS